MTRLLTIPVRLWMRGLDRVLQHIREVHRASDVAHAVAWALVLAPAVLGFFDRGSLPAWAWVGIVGSYYLVVAPLLVTWTVPPTAAEETARSCEDRLGPYQEENERLRQEVAQLLRDLASAHAEGQRYCERLEVENRLQRKALEEYRLEMLKRREPPNSLLAYEAGHAPSHRFHGADNSGEEKRSEVDLR